MTHIPRFNPLSRRSPFWAVLVVAPAIVGARGCFDHDDDDDDHGGGVGSVCGGRRGTTCASDNFCDFPPNAACGADQAGTCKARPGACTTDLDAVCGCDGQTYANGCSANAAGVSVASQGECVGLGGQCGGLLGATCGRGQFCDFAPEARCGAADQTGSCEPIPGACPQEIAPVCGCDGVSYGNACVANAAGASVASQGECVSVGGPCGGLLEASCGRGQFCNFPIEARCGAADEGGTCELIPAACPREFVPVCGCDGAMYANECQANAAGASVASQGDCAGVGEQCGGLLGTSCGRGQFCDFAPEARCGVAGQSGTCEHLPTACPRASSPVCGCDGATYANECVANATGVSVASQGDCMAVGEQ